MATSAINALQFQTKWQGSTRTERSASQEHFIDLCRLVGFHTPAEADPTGEFYTFERSVHTPKGRLGFADVWHRKKFGWEYKRDKKDLDAAYDQLQQYRESLENPPLLVTSDMKRIEIHTNFTNTAPKTHEVTIETIGEWSSLDLLQRVFYDPESFKPDVTVTQVTENAAATLARLAISVERRVGSSEDVAHFLCQIVFCLFAEDTRLLPQGLFSEIVEVGLRRPERFTIETSSLFNTMRTGGDFALREIARFNGGLFATVNVPELTRDELLVLKKVATMDWASVEPAIFGTLFERSLDPAQRKQLGAHYTPRADIERVIGPVVIDPLRRRWAEVRARALQLKERWRQTPRGSKRDRRELEFQRVLTDFQQELVNIRLLDPACGSGNFLYVALIEIQKLEKEVSQFGALNGLSYMLPLVRPTQLFGLEINPYARELAQVVVWIGHLQWMRANGFHPEMDPVLQPMDTIRLQDALIDRSDPGFPREAEWPTATFVVGNPPFLGAKQMRGGLGDPAVTDLHSVYRDRIPPFSDLVCYFFEKTRSEIARGNVKAAGLLATNSIRGGSNRTVLERIKASGDIFMAWDDEPWVQKDGTSVRISLVGFDDGSESLRYLDGLLVPTITSALTSGIDLSIAHSLNENADLCYQGIILSGPFDIPGSLARELRALPTNPNGQSNIAVVRPMANGLDITRRPRDIWVIDFGVEMSMAQAALYEGPFQYVAQHVKPVRERSRSQLRDQRWWLHLWPRPALRSRLKTLDRYLVTPAVAKHRVFAWLGAEVLPNHALIVFARHDDYFFGILESRAHNLWSIRMGTSLEDRPRYTPTTCFETFPLPWPPGQEPWRDKLLHEVANAAHELNESRNAWLNPPDALASELKNRTLTNLYNARPAWLQHAHAALDRAVWRAYGWNEDPSETPDEMILERLLALNIERSMSEPVQTEAS